MSKPVRFMTGQEILDSIKSISELIYENIMWYVDTEKITSDVDLMVRITKLLNLPEEVGESELWEACHNYLNNRIMAMEKAGNFNDMYWKYSIEWLKCWNLRIEKNGSVDKKILRHINNGLRHQLYSIVRQYELGDRRGNQIWINNDKYIISTLVCISHKCDESVRQRIKEHLIIVRSVAPIIYDILIAKVRDVFIHLGSIPARLANILTINE